MTKSTALKRAKRFKRIKDLQERYGDASRQSIWRWVRQGILPQPVHIGSIPMWDEDKLDAADEARQQAA